MKKLLSLLLVLTVVISSFAFFSFATETENLPSEEETTAEEETTTERVRRIMCDVASGGDGNVTAADARIILRYSVGLERINSIDILFADADSDGSIKASDARLALRTAVGFEKISYGEFEIIYLQEATCNTSGTIVAKNADGKTIEMLIKSVGHILDIYASCKGEGVCEVCRETVECPVTHKFPSDVSCVDSVRCSVCGHTKEIVLTHKYKNGKCTKCGDFNKKTAYEFLYNYVHTYGTYEAPDYCCIEDTEEMTLGMYYDTELEVLYLASNFYAYDQYGNYLGAYNIYLDFGAYLGGYKSEILIYYEDESIHAKYNVDAAKLNMNAPGAMSLYEYNGPEEVKNEVALICESVVIELIIWFDDFAARNDFGFSSLDMGFVSM